MNYTKNPFDLVKANDLSDCEIDNCFVDLPGGIGLVDRIKPLSSMSMFVLGGKGSGKTHLLRYLSSTLKIQKHINSNNIFESIQNDGYLGIYFRCSGLNGHRFSGKKQSTEKWQTIFMYYWDLWLAQLLLTALHDIHISASMDVPKEFVLDAVKLFDIIPDVKIETITELMEYIQQLKTQIDISVNNAGMTGSVDLLIRLTPGKIVFSLPELASKYIQEFSKLKFIYLIDEFENFTIQQQCYINTLIRERQDPVSFKIGVRLYGFKTKSTLCAGEENREDSEFEVLRLDTELREQDEKLQLEFATNLVKNRLLRSGYLKEDVIAGLNILACFDSGDQSRLCADGCQNIVKNYKDKLPPYFDFLKNKLRSSLKTKSVPGVTTEQQIDKIIDYIRVPEYPFVERTNIFMLYRSWSKKENLLTSAKSIRESAHIYINNSGTSSHDNVLRYYKFDILAQLFRETKQQESGFLGFETFVKMSGGLPRAFLTLMKNIFTWSVYLGETPFIEGMISKEAQHEGVKQASEWFFTESRATGPIGPQIRDSIGKLGQLMREIRFSDKPSECSICTFSVDIPSTSEASQAIIAEAVNWSMLIRVPGGQPDRNKIGRVDEKFQLHPMLAPRWDLPIARRGTITLSGDEIDSIFGVREKTGFENMLRKRVALMNVPFSRQAPIPNGELLPGLEHE